MTRIAKYLGYSIVLTMVSSGFALAKGHDQGVADGTSRDDTSQFVRNVPGPGLSSVVSQGRRGISASAFKGENRVEPVVNGRREVTKN